MAGWSITHKEPSTAPDASIDSSTGAASFPANQSTTTDNVYTIQYDNGNGCTETTTYTVKKCVPICTCSASAGGTVQCDASTSLVTVGSYSSSNCSGSWSASHKSGADFLYDFSFSNGTISAKVRQGSTVSTQSGTYAIGIDSCSTDVTFTQEKCTPAVVTHEFVVKLKFMNYTTSSWKEDGCFEGMTGGSVKERRNKICIQSLKIDGVDYTSTASVSLLVNAANGVDGSGNFLFGAERTISSGEVCKSQIMDYYNFYFCNPPSFSPAFELLPDYSFEVGEISITAGGITSTSNDSLSISFEETSQDCR